MKLKLNYCLSKEKGSEVKRLKQCRRGINVSNELVKSQLRLFAKRARLVARGFSFSGFDSVKGNERARFLWNDYDGCKQKAPQVQ
jgi:hypothetical protein